MDSRLEILTKLLLELSSVLKKQDFLIYFRKVSLIKNENNILELGFISEFLIDNVKIKFNSYILQAAKNIDSKINEVKYFVDNSIENPASKNVIDWVEFVKNLRKKTKKTTSDNIDKSNDIKTSYTIQEEDNNVNLKKYSLQNYIVWPSNQLAFAASEAVVRSPWKIYNPLYIYWDVGLWKTHLLQATWNEILKKYKNKVVRYMTADKFITEYVSAVKKKWVEKLRQKYAEADVIIIDDVQFLSKKEQTQNELYNIFNIFYDSQKQIIISWDRPPKELTELEPRLKSRFEWWIIVDISKPDFETRLAILQEKAREREFMIPQDVAEFIRSNVVDSIRELEWILNQLIAEYELNNDLPTLERVAKKLKKLNITDDLLWEVRTPSIKLRSYDDIIEAVSKHFGIEKEWILWENRKKEFMIPRQVSMYLLKTKLNYTYERIWNIFSWRNHASVLYSCNKLEQMLKKDRNLLYEVNTLRNWIWV